ncbi:hypothetical protein [Cytobacillus gottheilii]|uniref:hypothetical protein n=1 Tax=Cytobacillus gottheilii TaxID=859144 RepID=UPI00083390BE
MSQKSHGVKLLPHFTTLPAANQLSNPTIGISQKTNKYSPELFKNFAKGYMIKKYTLIFSFSKEFRYRDLGGIE